MKSFTKSFIKSFINSGSINFGLLSRFAILGMLILSPVKALAVDVSCSLILLPASGSHGVFTREDDHADITTDGVANTETIRQKLIQSCESSLWFFESKSKCDPENSPETATLQCFTNGHMIGYRCQAAPSGIYSGAYPVPGELVQPSKQQALQEALNACNQNPFASPYNPPRNCVASPADCHQELEMPVPAEVLEHLNSSQAQLSFPEKISHDQANKTLESDISNSSFSNSVQGIGSAPVHATTAL